MKVEKYIHGQDADGNRGVMVTDYILEDSDRKIIVEQVIDVVGTLFTVTMIDPTTEEEVEIEVNLKEWL